ncbi:MAG: hypothetical protein K6T99_00245 [Armatimonadetes bacterium]|nr:hypothetical protein [Armatimonadota bacterium]
MKAIRRVVFIVLMGLALSMITRYAYGSDVVKLEYKYVPGELLRYKMVADMKIHMTGGPNAASITMPVRIAGVFKQKTKRLLSDGDAEIILALESLRMEMMGKTCELPFKQIPPISMVVSKTGMVKGLASNELLGSFIPGGKLMCPSGMGTNMVLLPQEELRIGDTWARDFPKIEGLNNVKLTGKLLSIDFKVGKYTTAVFKQYFGSDFDMTSPMAMNAHGGSVLPVGGNMKGSFLGDTTVCFSAEKGQLIRTDGQLSMNMTASMPDTNGNHANVSLNVEIAYQMFLLSASTQK